jgi:hypothetical protein
MAKGKPKSFSKAEIERRGKRLAEGRKKLAQMRKERKAGT